jgi:NAD(P)-dependent dehydrogenase (short-subunit alcohol dehydrogenase family)
VLGAAVSQLAYPLLKLGAMSEKMAMMEGMGEPEMKRRYSSIINIGSASSTIPDRTGSIYAASKAAMDMLTKNLACEWAPDKIRVNCVSPWYIGTDLALQVRLSIGVDPFLAANPKVMLCALFFSKQREQTNNEVVTDPPMPSCLSCPSFCGLLVQLHEYPTL